MYTIFKLIGSIGRQKVTSKSRGHVEAGTDFDPLLRLHPPIAVEVGAEIAMTANAHFAPEAFQQPVHQLP